MFWSLNKNNSLLTLLIVRYSRAIAFARSFFLDWFKRWLVTANETEWKRKSGKRSKEKKGISIGRVYVATLVWDNVSLNRKSTSRRLHLPSRKKHLTSATTQGGFSTVGNIAAHSDFEDSPRLEASFDRWSIMRRRCFSPTSSTCLLPSLFYSSPLFRFSSRFSSLYLYLWIFFSSPIIFFTSSLILFVFLKVFFLFYSSKKFLFFAPTLNRSHFSFNSSGFYGDFLIHLKQISFFRKI